MTPVRARNLTLISFVVLLFSLASPSVLRAALCCSCTAPDDPKAAICIQALQADCGLITKESKNPDAKALNCTTSLNEGQCRLVTQGGVCAVQANEMEYKTKTGNAPSEKEKKIYTPPKLGVPIPGLDLAENIVIDKGLLRIPWTAQYLAAFQRYLIGLSVVAAAIMIVYGGFLYITGSAAGSVTKGKTLVYDALIGLLLVLGAYTILKTLNVELVSPTAQELRIVHRRDALSDPNLERARVAESARVKAPLSAGEIPIVDVDAPVTKETPTAPAKEGVAVIPPPVPGEIAKDAAENLIARGNCPIDMVPIRYSEDYAKKIGKKVESFCIDLFEAPNQRGAIPFNGVTEWEADWYCQERGKRLCSDSEWTRACLGPKGENVYGYGPEFKPGLWVSAEVPNQAQVKKGGNEPGPCNYDTNNTYIPGEKKLHGLDYLLKKASDSILNLNNPLLSDPLKKKIYDAVKEELKKVTKAEPSGKRPSCVTAEGVFDMTGNLQEIVVKDPAAALTTEQRIAKGTAAGDGKQYSWAGFYWSPVAHLANTSAKPTCTQRWGKPHAVNWRAYENTVRCCMNLYLSE